MSRLEFSETPLSGVMQVQRQRLQDERGFLSRLFCAEELAAANWREAIAQVNHTLTRHAGTVRGMHYQLPPYAECKLVSCLRGEVWDVALDLRKGSPTFLRWHAVRLSADNGLALLLPEGVAHGFQALAEEVELLYCHSRPYVADSERGVSPLDPRLAIDWPLPVRHLSQRDRSHPPIGTAFCGVST
jgi:dTDP-4-dehydrorhamnose 3,5-epimerase